ncbi:MAG: GNVR domain-containing protein [Steroidobacteraceae bacterium]
MNQQVAEILHYVAGVWRRRRLALIVAWAICGLAWFVVLLLPNVYEASARVFVTTRTPLRPMLRGIAVDDDLRSQLNMVQEALLSRPQLEAVVRKNDLDAGVKSTADMDAAVASLRKSIVIEVRGRQPDRPELDDSGLYAISYRNASQDKSVAVVRTLLDNFLENTLQGKREGTDEAQKFLRQQIKEYETRLSEAEARLAEFKKNNLGMIPGEEGDYFSRLDKEMDGLQTAETNLAVALSRRSELRRQLSSATPYVPGTSGSGGSSSGAVSDVSLRRQEAEAKLEELLLRFTEKHPEVIALRGTIAELKDREAKELAELSRGGKGTGAIRSLSANPVFQNIQVQLNQADVEIASLRGAITQHKSEIAKLKGVVDTAPEVEQELARLNRDYGVTKSQYEALVGRLEQARVSEDAAKSGIVRFDVMEPPKASSSPVWPNRPLLVLASLLIGPILGILVALGLNLLHPTFSSARMLERVTQLPVLGAISALKRESDAVLQRAAARRYVIAGAALVVCGVVFALFANFGARMIYG